MRFLDLVSLIVDNLARRKGRVALTAVGVIIGTAAVVLLVSLATGLQKNANDRLGNIGELTNINVWPSGGDMYYMGPGGGGMMEDSQMNLLTTQALKDIAAIDGVSEVIPQEYMYSSYFVNFGRMETYGSMIAYGTEDLSVFDWKVAEGDVKLEKGTCIVGGWMAKNFFDPKLRPGQEPPPPPDLLGQTLKITFMKWDDEGNEVRRIVRLRVVGVLLESRSEADGSLIVRMDEMTAWNEWARGSRINRNKEGYQMVIVKANDSKKVVEISDQINELGYMANTAQAYVEGVNSFFVIMQLIFGGVGAIALLVAAIGIANTMTMAILERTREIGLMKAIGATNRDVLSIFLGEAAGIGFLGGIGGTLLGWLGGQLLNVAAMSYLSQQVAESGGLPPSVAVYTPPWLPLFALIFATIIGLLSGLYPALQAATVAPVMALKYE